jgi:hypothetical protein
MNPIVAFPPPVRVHDGEDRTVDGAALSRHHVSAVNPVALPLTTVPIGPDAGATVKVGTGPVVIVKLATAESPEPPFVVTVTV